MKVIIIGGVAAGMSAASKMRRLDNDVEITVYEKGKVVSYGACGLPYYISNENDSVQKLIARDLNYFKENNINVKLRNEVVKVFPKDKKILVKDLDTCVSYIDQYDRLFIATGSSPIRLNIPGSSSENVFELKTIEDADKIKSYAAKYDVKDVIVIGGGYIGVELADAMIKLGKKVRIIELGDNILSTFDADISVYAARVLKDHGVDINTGERVEALIHNQNKVSGVKTSKGIYNADMVIQCVGVKPNTNFLKGTEIDMTPRGAIIIDREMRTSVSDIYSAGDCAVVYHKVMEENRYIPLGTTANKMGRLAAENLLGKRKRFVGTLGSAAIKVVDWEFARTGISQKEAEELKIDYDTKMVKAYSHPAYYPDQTPIYIKLLYDKNTKKVLGVQSAGEKGVVLRIDIFASAIHNEMTAMELGMVDFCYAPPFAGVWDAVHIACNAIK